MNYKKMILCLLLVPFSMVGAIDSVRLQELEKLYFQKLTEISELGEEILERKERFSSMASDANSALETFVESKIKGIEEQELRSLSEKERKKISDEIGEQLDQFIFAFFTDYKNMKTVEGAIHGKIEDGGHTSTWELIKFHYIHVSFERGLIAEYLKKYERLVKELCAIEHEMKNSGYKK
jgi:hypothetical protein